MERGQFSPDMSACVYKSRPPGRKTGYSETTRSLIRERGVVEKVISGLSTTHQEPLFVFALIHELAHWNDNAITFR